MPIATTCAACQHPFQCPDQTAGLKVACPRCKAPTRVPVMASTVPIVRGDPELAPVDERPGPLKPEPIRVVVVDFDMPLWSMIRLLVNFSLAAIPAALILGFLGLGFWLVVAWLLGR